MNLHPFWPVFHAQSNSTGRIGSKSIEIDASWIHWDDTQFDQVAILCTGRHTNVILVNFHPIWPVFNARSNSTREDRIWPNPQIGCKSTGMILNLIREAYNVISVNFHPIWPVFNARLNLTNQSNLTGGIEFDPPLKLGVNALTWYPIRPGRDTM